MIPRECEKCIHCRVCAYNNPKRKPHCDFYEESRQTDEWVRKEDVIHSIAKQYSEHHELVPIWLRIGDMKGGAE